MCSSDLFGQACNARVQRLVETRPGPANRQIGLSGERLHGGGEFADGRLVDELDGVAESDAERDGENRQSEPALVLRERREQEAAADRVAAHCAMLARGPRARDQPRLGGLWLIRIQYIPSWVTAPAKAEKSIGLRT